MRTQLILLFLILIQFSNAQTLHQKLEGKTHFKEIQQIANKHYDDIRNGILKQPNGDMKEKHWRRAEWFLEPHLDEKGHISDYSNLNFKAEQQTRRMDNEMNRATTSSWTFTGPDKHIADPTLVIYIGLGRVDRMAFHPTDPNTIYIGTPAGGLWRTEDDGDTWEPLSDFLPNIGISGIQISPNDPNLIYVLTGDGDSGSLIGKGAGVFKSTDGGETWLKTGTFYSGSYNGFMLEMDPNDDQTLLAATNQGIHKTTDGGANWELMTTGKHYDVKYKPFSSDTIYAVTQTSIRYSHDGGIEWETASATPAPISGRKAIAVSPANPDLVYVHTGGATGPGTFSGFFSSSDGGVNYLRVSNTPNICGSGPNESNDQSWWDHCVAAHPQFATTVVTGGLVIFRSTSGGGVWNQISTYGTGSGTPGYVHPDIHAIQFNPLNNHLYAATDGGFYKSTDIGSNWTNLSEGIRTTQFYSIDAPQNNSIKVLGGSQDNGLKQRISNTMEVDHLGLSDALCGKYDPNDHTVFYAGNNGGLSKYINSGSSNVGIAPVPNKWYHNVEVHPSNSNYVYTGLNNPPQFYISDDQGSSWDTLQIPAGNCIEKSPSNGGRIYVVGLSDEMHRIDGLGSSITAISGTPGFPSGNVLITDIAVHPTNSAHVVIALGGYVPGKKIYRSTDAGATWSSLSSGLPNIPFHAVAINSNGDIFAGSDIGVFYWSGAGWIPFRNNMPATMVSDLVIQSNYNHIRAATYGRGFWKSTLPDGSCSPEITWLTSTTLDGYYYYEADQKIENFSTIEGGIETQVFFKAGNHIDLKPGFRAKDDGSFFKAYLGPCGTGIPSGN